MIINSFFEKVGKAKYEGRRLALDEEDPDANRLNDLRAILDDGGRSYDEHEPVAAA